MNMRHYPDPVIYLVERSEGFVNIRLDPVPLMSDQVDCTEACLDDYHFVLFPIVMTNRKYLFLN